MWRTLSKAFEMSRSTPFTSTEDCYQKQLAFHVLLTVAALHMSHLVENLIEKV